MEKQLLDAITNTQRCQRNWDLTKQMPQEHIDLLLKIATTTPTKQNREWFQIAYTTDRSVIKDLYAMAYDPKDSEFWQKTNTQITSHLVLIYLEHTNEDDVWKGGGESDDVTNPRWRKENTIMSSGISLGAVAIAANLLGYRTGFCQCFLPDEFRAYMTKQFGLPQDGVMGVTLGIGIPKEGVPHTRMFWEEAVAGLHEADHQSISTIDPKNITVTRLQK
tara:strand:- start:2860 stop:3519 length:660 start_codon:yes stop_codon:yes gene_type:complete